MIWKNGQFQIITMIIANKVKKSNVSSAELKEYTLYVYASSCVLSENTSCFSNIQDSYVFVEALICMIG